MERNPYEFLPCISVIGADRCYRIRRADLAECYGMTLTMLNFLNVHGRCFRCGSALADLERHSGCQTKRERFYDDKHSDFEVLVPELLSREFSVIKTKEDRRRNSFIRNLRVERASGQHTRQEIIELLHRQEHRCYYCFCSFIGSDGRVNGPGEPVACHKEHYQAVLNGGSNDIVNLVLACPSCNSRKQDMHGDMFAKESLKKASKADREGLKRIQRARSEFMQRMSLGKPA